MMNITQNRYKWPFKNPARKALWLLFGLTAALSISCGSNNAALPGPDPSATALSPTTTSRAPGQGSGTGTAPSGGTQGPSPTSSDGIAPGDGTITGKVVVTRPANFADIKITVTENSEQVAVETIAQDLEVPWALDFAPDGRIFVTERPGRIRVVQGRELQREPFAVLDQVVSVSESGLMGIALHPEFAENGFLYICYTYQNRQGNLRNRVARLTDTNGTGTDHQIILDDIPGSRNHNGCRIAFGPDEKLYVTTGDGQNQDLAQDLDSLGGKVLRLEADGSVPEDNPFTASYVYTYGHRNVQGLDWHPQTGELYITEHGPSRNDEINLLKPGRNYGWPAVTGRARSEEFVGSLIAFTPTLAIAGAAFYSGDILPASWQGSLIFATLKASQLHRVELHGTDFQSQEDTEVLVDQDYGRLRAVAVSPDGYLYFTTSNRDGRGDRQPRDDKLLRLAPVPAGAPTTYRPDAEGNFSLDLGPGVYQVLWESEGFKTKEVHLTLTDNQSVDLGKIVLEP